MSVGLASSGAAQGGWRQWDIHLRDGRRVEANPLGAPDDDHIAISVGGMVRHDLTFTRSQIDYIAAQVTMGPDREPLVGMSLPPKPTGRACEDLIVYRDGRRTTGRVTFTRIAYSEGVVRQGDDEVDLQDVAYIKFANGARHRCSPPAARHPAPARRASP